MNSSDSEEFEEISKSVYFRDIAHPHYSDDDFKQDENTLHTIPAAEMLEKYGSALDKELLTDCKDVEKCPALKRITMILEIYAERDQIDATMMDECTAKYSQHNSSLIVDYHHLLSHLNCDHVTKRKHYQIMHEQMRRRVSCDITACAKFRRYNRSRDRQLTELEERIENIHDKEEKFYVELLDTIHCYFLHLLDTGYLILENEIKTNDDNEQHDDEQEDEEELFHSQQLQRVRENVQSKTVSVTEMVDGSPALQTKPSKFLTTLNLQHKELLMDSLQRMCETQPTIESLLQFLNDNEFDSDAIYEDMDGGHDEESNIASYFRLHYANHLDAVSQVQAEINAHANIRKAKTAKTQLISHTHYAFGYRFWYWSLKGQRHRKQFEFYQHWQILRKYQNLKQEVLAIKTLQLVHYERVHFKAKTLQKESLDLRALRSEDGNGLYPYGIPNESPFSLKHIMVVIFYCTYSDLSAAFSESFRKSSQSETDSNLMNRHRNWYHFAKTLRETVELYGIKMKNSKIKCFYHGVSMVYFSRFVANFCCPTSTTSQLEVAARFTNETNGVILQLQRTKYNKGDHLKYFNCTLVSPYADEDERLFIGGMAPLEFVTIFIVRNNLNLLPFVKGLTLFNRLLEGQLIDGTQVRKQHFKVLRTLSDTFIGHRRENKYPEYINECFRAFVEQKKEITIIPWAMPTKYRERNKSLLVGMNAYNQTVVKVDNLMRLFKNVEVINVNKMFKETEMENVTRKINQLYILDILNRLRNINKLKQESDAIDYKLHTIRYHVDNSDYMITYNELYAYEPKFDGIGWRATVRKKRLIFTANL